MSKYLITEQQEERLKRVIQKTANIVLEMMKNHFSYTDEPAEWMHDTLDESEVDSIKKIIVLDIKKSEMTDYLKCDVKVILDGKKINRIREPLDTLDSMDYKMNELLGMRIYLYVVDVVADDFDPQF